MEEKNATKISLSTYFLVIAMFAIVVMGAFIYKLNNDKNTEIKKSANLQAQVNSLNGTVNDLQGKINTISETVNSNNSTKTSSTNNNNNNNPFTNEQVKEAFQKYLDLTDLIVNSPEDFLRQINLKIDNNNKEAKKNGYKKTTIKYTDFKNALLNYVTNTCYESNFEQSIFIEEDGYLCFLPDVGATGHNYKVENITPNNNNSYNAKVISTPSDTVESNYEFGIENNNGKCVIDYCNKK